MFVSCLPPRLTSFQKSERQSLRLEKEEKKKKERFVASRPKSDKDESDEPWVRRPMGPTHGSWEKKRIITPTLLQTIKIVSFFHSQQAALFSGGREQEESKIKSEREIKWLIIISEKNVESESEWKWVYSFTLNTPLWLHMLYSAARLSIVL